MATKRKRLASASYQSATPKKDNKASIASESWDKNNNKRDLGPPFETICIKAAELEAYSRYSNTDRNEDKVQKDMKISVREETRKQNQARLATILARLTAERLLGDKKTGTKGVLKSERKLVPKKSGMRFFSGFFSDEKPTIVKLTGTTIFPEVDGLGEHTSVGTLEAHIDEFKYTTSSSRIHLQFTFKNVKESFFQVEDQKKMLPLLHFHLHHPIKVGTKKTKDIQFRLVSTVVRKRRSNNGSDKNGKEKQTRDRGRNEDLKNFVDKVQNNWCGSPSPFSFQRVLKDEEFHGVLSSKAPDVFILTFSSLIQLANAPFVVVDLEDIEIVNLARLRPREIDMTVVFKDFKCGVLQISSIPLDSLYGIKTCLNLWGVKFYENDLNPNWNSIVKKIVNSPKTFIQEGGWDAYKLEDNATSLYYMHYHLEASQVVYDDTDTLVE